MTNKVYSWLLIFSLLLGSTILSLGQRVKGSVTDSKTGELLAYVNIGILYKNMGTISHEDGLFVIDLSSAKETDLLVFSMIGYETIKIEVGKIKEATLTIKMVPKLYQLRDVVVKPKKIKEPLKLGRSKTTHTTTGRSGYDSYGYGDEWGIQIFTEGKKYWVDDIRFHLRFNTVDSVLFRVHLYASNEGLPGENLLLKDTFVKSYKKEHWIICHIEDQNLVISQPVFVSFEVVRFWAEAGADNQFFFTHGANYDRGGAYSRQSSQADWRVNKSPKVVLCLGVEEFLDDIK